jgi:hypothetical protein
MIGSVSFEAVRFETFLKFFFKFEETNRFFFCLFCRYGQISSLDKFRIETYKESVPKFFFFVEKSAPTWKPKPQVSFDEFRNFKKK